MRTGRQRGGEVTCTGCGRAHGPAARFCAGCGTALPPRCPACGAVGAADAQFCEACGAALGGRAAEAGVRKVVTIVFADLAGSTSLQERLDAESARRLMDRYYRTLHRVVAAHGGTVVKLLGDGVMAAFGVPRVAEDDALRAVRAAVGMQHAFRQLLAESARDGGGLGLRIAINSGEVVVSSDHADIVGDPVNVAARLQQEASDGEVVIGESTRRLVSELVTLAPLGAIALKGRAESVAAYRVVSLDRPAGAPALPFVGRDEELRRLLAVYEAAAAAPGPRLAVLLGSPGLGKSRLIAELARRLGARATVLMAHCDAAGGATFAPLADALRAHLRLDDGGGDDGGRAAIGARVSGDEAERARVGDGIAALLAGSPAAPEETFFVVRRLIAGLGRTQPVVLVIDDLQWAEPLLLDLIEHLVQWSTGVPLLVLAAARPELRDTRAALAVAGGLVDDVVALGGLDASAATRLAANVLGAHELPAAVAGRVLATSEGNPLFLGELVRMLVDDGALRLEGDRWVAAVDLAHLEVPPTIHALLSARVERLRPDDRTVLERAAVVGRLFSRAAVSHLLPPELRDDLDARLASLRAGELIEPTAGWFLSEPLLRFHHALIRDAAYRRLLKGTRAELHSRFADWLESHSGERVEHDESIGWHLEQAHQHLLQLGPLDAAGRAVGERAARHLAAAGRRALARDDLPPAASLLGRALGALDADAPARAELALDWCEALLAAGDVGPAASAIDELARCAELPAGQVREEPRPPGVSRLRAWHTCFAGQMSALTAPQGLQGTADAVAAAADTLAAVGDVAGEAKAHSVHAVALARLGMVGASEAALDRALAAARRAGDRRRANAVLAGAPLAALWGPSPVTRASGRCLDVVRVLRGTQGARAVEAVALRCQAVLEALRGRLDAARRMVAESRAMVEELGIMHRLLEADVFAGIIELLAGDAPAAERWLRAAYDGLRGHGLAIDAAQAAALLGRALLAQDRAAEAEALSHASEALAGDDLKAAIAWRGVRAEALARRGESASALELAHAAVAIAAATDALLDHADARVALAAALRAAGRHTEADAESAQAIELWQAKGATLLADPTRPSDTAPPPLEGGLRSDLEREPNAVGSIAPTPTAGLENAATRAGDRLIAALSARDRERLVALLPAGFRSLDRQGQAQIEVDRDQYLAGLGPMFGRFASAPTAVVLATRGDRLALLRVAWTGGDAPGGSVEVESIDLLEVDDRGAPAVLVAFDSTDVEAAYAELDRRYAAGEAAVQRRTTVTRTFSAAFAARDWPALTALLAPDLVVHDHRLLGWEPLHGPAPYVEALRSLVELAPDVRLRIDHIRMSQPGFLYVTTWVGSREGGAFETPSVIVSEIDDEGRIRRFEQYDLDQLDQARARLDAIASSTAAVGA